MRTLHQSDRDAIRAISALTSPVAGCGEKCPRIRWFVICAMHTVALGESVSRRRDFAKDSRQVDRAASADEMAEECPRRRRWSRELEDAPWIRGRPRRLPVRGFATRFGDRSVWR